MKKLSLLLIAVGLTCQANADNYRDMESLTLETPEMKAELVKLPEQSTLNFDRLAPTTSSSPKMDFDIFKSKTNPGVKPYKFMDDMTFVGVPLFVAGWALKSDKAMFRVNAKAEQDTIHHGENRGKKDVILYMFYLSQKDLPLAVQHPEIPLD